MENKKVDFLIIGQGLAGSILALSLIEAGKTVLVLDNADPESSSQVAAGIINPITGRRFSLTWMHESLIPFASNFYSSLEKKFSTRFFYPKAIFRPEAKVSDIKAEFVEETAAYFTKPEQVPSFLNNGKEQGLWFKGANLDCACFLNACKEYFKASEMLITNQFSFDKFEIISENEVKYENIRAEKIIFCEGYQAVYNPYFKYLPFNCVKGEILDIELSEKCSPDFILSKGVFLLAKNENTYRLGATYTWNTFDRHVTEEAKIELQGKVENLLSVPFKIKNHRAAIRPATKHRRPFIGLHYQFPAIGIFNGLGTKGVLLAPFWAQHFALFLLQKTKLAESVDIEMYKPL